MNTVTFTLRGRTHTISRDDVLQAARSVLPARVTKFYVEIAGQRFPATQLIRAVARSRDPAHSTNSRSILTELGFVIRSLR